MTTDGRAATGPKVGPAPAPTDDNQTIFGPPAPAKRRHVEAIALRRRDVGVVLATGIAGDLALRHLPGGNLAGSLIILTLTLGLVFVGRATASFTRRCLAGAVFFGVMLSVRSDPRLVVFNALAALILIVLAAAPPARFFDTRPIQAIRNAVEAMSVTLGLVVELPGQARAQQQQRIDNGASSQTGAILRGIVIAVPVVGVIGLLLASADAVFGSFFAVAADSSGTALGHLLLVPIGALTMGILIRLRTANTSLDDEPTAPRMGRTEALVVLALLDALFVLFTIAQVVARSDLGDAVLLDNGLDYKDHARQGFFQLLWVAGITLAVLLALRSTTFAWSQTSRAFQSLSLTAVALTIVIVGVAFSRLQLYIDDNGLTPLRFYSSVFALWIGTGFGLIALRLLGWRSDRAWMLPALALSGLVTLAGLDLANPEAIIATNNLERNERALLWHVDKLTGDGLRVVIEGLDQLDPALRLELTTDLCDDGPSRLRLRTTNEDHDRLAWNLGTSRGTDALEALCQGT